MRGLRVRQAAEDDLVGIGEETKERWGEAQMARYLTQLDAALQALARMPMTGSACDDVRPGLRRYVAGSHVIFYAVVDGDVVDVLRVLHRRMDVTEQLDDDS